MRFQGCHHGNRKAHRRQKKGVLLLNKVSPQLEVLADRDRLSQILVNLIDNAVKYTPEGGQIVGGGS